MRVKVSFYVEADEPEHDTGVTNDTYDEITNAVMTLGGEDVDFEKEVPTDAR